MNIRILKPARAAVALPADYAPLLAEIKARVQTARVKAESAPAIVQGPLAQTDQTVVAIVHQPDAQLTWKHFGASGTLDRGMNGEVVLAGRWNSPSPPQFHQEHRSPTFQVHDDL